MAGKNRHIAVDKRSDLYARQLQEESENIIQEWDRRVRQEVPAARQLERLALRDSVPEFLKRLIGALSDQDQWRALRELGDVGKEHGKERARQGNYKISEVLAEYLILRNVIFDAFERDEPLPPFVRNVVLFAFDEGIRSSVERFAEERTRNLEQSNRDLEHFAAVAAHDLKSPLATISGFLDFVEERLTEKGDLKTAEDLKRIRQAAARMSLMIDRLLEFSSVGEKHDSFRQVKAREIVDHVLENLKEMMEKARAQVVVGDLPEIKAEPSLLSLVFQNLISNAIKFHGERPPRIRISVEDKMSEWVFSVRDNGMGFDPEKAQNIFSIFERYHPKSDQEGFGIGLATAKKIVGLHGGEIWAESGKGEGATFFFSIPK